jgi:hypothetical protein
MLTPSSGLKAKLSKKLAAVVVVVVVVVSNAEALGGIKFAFQHHNIPLQYYFQYLKEYIFFIMVFTLLRAFLNA